MRIRIAAGGSSTVPTNSSTMLMISSSSQVSSAKLAIVSTSLVGKPLVVTSQEYAPAAETMIRICAMILAESIAVCHSSIHVISR